MENINLNPTNESGRKPVGAWVGTLIILCVLVFACLYLWSTNIQPRLERKEATQTSITQTTDPIVTQINLQSSSDETTSIENDLKATNVDDTDKELQAL